ncbi:MAG: hypothetical protein HDS87_06520 [Bacteroidales bacterium]|nr:hypothetical protein [Bacteroidales bacterium]
MIHRILTSAFYAIFAIAAMAQSEATDSIKTQELNEVIDQADKMYMTVNKVSYSPTKQQRNASANGTMLLQQLAIPQLTVDALAGTVRPALSIGSSLTSTLTED